MIYLDHSSATFIEDEVLDTLYKVEKEYYANPDGLHDFSLKVKKLQEQARSKVAALLNVAPEEIIFTSGASESNSLAIKGYIEKHKHLKK